VSEPDGEAASTIPPLLATPGGVCSTHEVVPVGLRKTSQKVLLGSCRCPMAIRTDDPVGVVVDALIAAAGVLLVPTPPAPPVTERATTAAAAMAVAGSLTQRFVNA
jgi:hypothetical protein